MALIRLLWLIIIVHFACTELYPCPDPVRPKAAFNSIIVTESSDLELCLQMIKCKSGTKQDIAFRHVTFKIDGKGILLPAFFRYDLMHVQQGEDCHIFMYHSPTQKTMIEEFPFLLTYKSWIVFMCDHRMTNCKSVRWKCRVWKKDTDEERIVGMISEVLTPNKNNTVLNGGKKEHDTVPITVVKSTEDQTKKYIIYYLIGAPLLFLLILGIILYPKVFP